MHYAHKHPSIHSLCHSSGGDSRHSKRRREGCSTLGTLSWQLFTAHSSTFIAGFTPLLLDQDSVRGCVLGVGGRWGEDQGAAHLSYWPGNRVSPPRAQFCIYTEAPNQLTSNPLLTWAFRSFMEMNNHMLSYLKKDGSSTKKAITK